MLSRARVKELYDTYAEREEHYRLAGDREMADIYWGGLVALGKVLRGRGKA